MRRLLLLRHAKTEHDAPSRRDRDRALDERGRIEARLMALHMVEKKLVPDAALISPALRTQQTWTIASNEWPPCPAQTIEQLYGAETGEVLDVMRGAPKAAKRLLICGHNPGLHELALALTAEGADAARRAISDNFPTAALAVIDFDIGQWADITLRSGRLDQFITPKMLRTG